MDTIDEIKDVSNLSDPNAQTALQKLLSELPAQVLKLGLNLGARVVIAIICYIVGSKLIGLARKIILKSLRKAGVEKGAQTFIDACVKFALYAVLILVVASQFGFDATSVVAILGSIGLTVGLALQGSFSNFAGGIIILVMKPFKVGDYIIEDSNKNEGIVTGIHMFYTFLRTYDNKVILVPNGTLCNNSLTNLTFMDERRVDFSVGISYDSDIKLAKETLSKIIKEEPHKLKDREPQIFVKSLGDDSVVIGANFWVKPADYFAASWYMNEKVKLTFDEVGISIPFRQLDVHFDKNEAVTQSE
ncbi:MAG: mechanosensitive ion channel family protein [Lachnospiraceae bacterium]|nr:mechanosensitive ion channel family protein [Lachnospiraceae bacterium]